MGAASPNATGVITLADTATALGPAHAGRVVVCGSHGAAYTGCLAARAGVRGAFFSDAGIGKDSAGIGALAELDRYGVPAAVVDFRSARIGDAADLLGRGLVSGINLASAAIGCAVGEPVSRSADRMASAEVRIAEPPACAERRRLIEERNGFRVWALDSASQVLAEDRGAIVITGSHGGLVGGAPMAALKTEARLAVFNDAGVGADRAGIGRLAALEARGVAAVTVAAMSARIGDGQSTYEDGVISFVNGPAAARGARPGMTTRALVAVFLEPSPMAETR